MAMTVAALALAAAPLAAQGGQGRGPGQGQALGRGMMQGGPEAMARNPVTVVLEHQEALELTAEQRETLQGLEARIEEQNGPRWEQLKAAFGDAEPAELTVEERQALRARMQELAPVRDSVRATTRAVMAEVHGLLDADQNAELRGIMRRGPRGQGAGAALRAGRGQGAGPGPGPAMRGPRADGLIGAAWRSGFQAGRAGCRATGLTPRS